MPDDEPTRIALSRRWINGDTALSALLLAGGLYWTFAAVPLGLWQGFAPSTGFLPFCYGVLLTVLAGAILVDQLSRTRNEIVGHEVARKPLALIGLVALTILGIEIAGFAPAVFIMLLVIFLWLERLAIVSSLVVATGTTLALHLLFRVWLGVPLPEGPLGI